MHKRLVNHCTINLSIIPDGPILIKSGREGADPTNPDMEFVRTFHKGGWSIYLPGSSLKGGESSEAAISRHATAENATQREFQKNFSTFTRK